MLSNRSYDARPAVQRTTWRYSSGAWKTESTSTADTDTYDDPDTYCTNNAILPGEHDKYDQNTGEYFVWSDATSTTEARATKKKRPKNYGNIFDEARESTPYPYFKPRATGEQRNASLQGPHLLAHVTKRTIFDLSKQMGLDPYTIVGSKLGPKPRQALQMMYDLLKGKKLTATPGAISVWYRAYKAAYGLALSPSTRGRAKYVKQLLELHPLTTYRVGQQASKAELAPKNEKAAESLSDINTLLATPRGSGVPGGLTTVDAGYRAEGWSAGDTLREDFIFNYALMASGRPPSPSPYAEAPSSPMRDDDW
jgi:hypothetical protein